MNENKTKSYTYDAERNGKKRIWNVYADNPEEAEQSAKAICKLLDAAFLGNNTEGRTCKI